MVDFALAAKSFIVHDGKLLILKRSATNVQKPSIWELPGGRLKPAEDPYKGLKRETKEEAGIDIDILHTLNVSHFTRDDGQIITLMVFLCKAKSDNVVLSNEHTDYEWIPLKECKNKLNEFFHKEVDIFHNLELYRHV